MGDEGGRAPSVEEALATILREVARGAVERVPLAEAAGRVLAEPVVAAEDLWPFARAAMDGIAARAVDVATASPEHPVRLRIGGAVYAGQAVDSALPQGTCVRVATGAPLPPGADAVIPQEILRFAGGAAIVSHPVPAGQHIFPAGEDARAGERVLEPGIALRGGHLGLLASIGCASVPVVRRPIVTVLTCGDELVDAADALRPGLVRESNRYTLAVDVEAIGGRVLTLPNVRDDPEAMDAAIRRGLQTDVLITTGGLSVGERDLVRPALRRAGVALAFDSVAMKPGARVAFGWQDRRLVFGLPGTPSACRVAFQVLVAPALRAMLGYRDAVRPPVAARLTAPVRVRPGRRRYLWGLASIDADGLRVAPHLVQSTATLRAASDANALIVVDAKIGDLTAGRQVPILLLEPAAVPAAPARAQEVIGVAGARGAGKTRLIERLILELSRHDVSVAVIKHHAHQRALDDEGSDTARAAAAGAALTILAGPGGVTVRAPSNRDPSLGDALLHVGQADLVLVEGFNQAPIPKILVAGGGEPSTKVPPAGPIIATVGDAGGAGAEVFRWDQLDRLARFLLARIGRSAEAP
jgi:molybdopterin molybdotransferase